MLKIRQEQWDVFSKLAQDRFEDDMVAHVQRFFPEKCAELGDDGVRGAVRDGVERAAGHELELEHDIQRFLNIMFALDLEFDTNPDHPWVAEVLEDSELTPSDRIEELCARAEARLEAAEHERAETNR